MDDILASIRRILAEDETGGTSHPAPEPAASPADPGILDLDPSMLVAEPPVQAEAAAIKQAPPVPRPEPQPVPPQRPVMAEPPPPPFVNEPQAAPDTLVAPEAAASAAASVGTLVRHLAAERHLNVTRSGPSLEDVIRDEIRPLLKQWLDLNLPPMVERLVRAEIARVVDRAVG